MSPTALARLDQFKVLIPGAQMKGKDSQEQFSYFYSRSNKILVVSWVMKKSLFKMLARINKMVLPSVSKLNVNKLSKADKVLVAYKYWVTLHVLD